jgi:beta-glucosidase/6-phospho-beta-glucosidase/beta-galactosidase
VALTEFLRRDARERPFMFATGLECSYPVIRDAQGRRLRIDEYEKTGHYERWREDFGLVKEMGIRFLRYGVPYYRAHRGPGRYDWGFMDETFHALREAKITPIADLCHFGLPDWLDSFQNPDFPAHFAEFAKAFAERFPWVELFTPVNEIRIACEFSALMGFWNEQEASDRAYVTALKTTARANILAEEAILSVNPHAVFVQSEATGYFHATSPKSLKRTHFLNQRRFLSLDLCYGHEVGAAMLVYLLDNGMSLDEYRWFLEHGQRITFACVMGNDYYSSNEHMVPPGDAAPYPAGPVYGYYMLTRQYFDRYQLPVMHTETNQRDGNDPVRWLRNQWLCLIKLKEDGVPLVGFTWYSLIDQVDWDTSLRENAGRENPLGLYDLDRKIRPVGEAYRELIRQWRDILPMESRRLDSAPLIDLDQPGQRQLPKLR